MHTKFLRNVDGEKAAKSSRRRYEDNIYIVRKDDELQWSDSGQEKTAGFCEMEMKLQYQETYQPAEEL
jgi:hypothetical protein